MGLFDKKNCDICGDKIGLLGNRKLDNGNLCKNCAGKLSPWFEERRHSTVEDIKRQLAYREENKNAVRNFRVTREFSADRYHVFIDDNKGMFAVAFNMSEQNNPDIVPLSAITSCRMEIDEDREEEKYTDQDGESRSYVPPRYTYSYDYKIKLSVNTPWFDDMDFQLNTFSVKDCVSTYWRSDICIWRNDEPGLPAAGRNDEPGLPAAGNDCSKYVTADDSK